MMWFFHLPSSRSSPMLSWWKFPPVRVGYWIWSIPWFIWMEKKSSWGFG